MFDSLNKIVKILILLVESTVFYLGRYEGVTRTPAKTELFSENG